DVVGEVAARFVTDHDATAVVLPVALFAGGSDARATQRVLAGRLAVTPVDVESPADLALAVSRCRVVVTGSYHAAVFALAGGVPVVGLSKSAYYDVNFTDLAGLFPGATWQVRLGAPDTVRELAGALEAAWNAAPPIRAETHARARRQVEAGRAAYTRFLDRAGVSSR
ncbi:MAG: polysaccharide pyruvyl transferase family protein, partial [Mycobacteriales bacterium]